VTGERETIVALVVLKPGSGRAITGESVITAETLREFAPAPGDAEAVTRALAGAGFDVGPVVGVAMSVTGPRSRFEEFFGMEVADADDGGWVVAGGDRELPLDALPEDVRRLVHAVTFEPPAEALELP
jgi:hypothetical protein